MEMGCVRMELQRPSGRTERATDTLAHYRMSGYRPRTVQESVGTRTAALGGWAATDAHVEKCR